MGNTAQPTQALTNDQVAVTLVSKKQQILEFNPIKTLKITKAINDHVRVLFTGTMVIPEEITDQPKYIMDYLNEFNLDQWEIRVETLKIKQMIANATGRKKQEAQDAVTKEVFFLGLVTNVALTAVNGAYDLTVEGASYTYKLDIALHNRSFQNGALTFQQLIEKILAKRAICEDVTQQTGPIKRLFVQYKVTDWSFLTRMASWQNSGLVADCLESMPKFWFRVPDRSKQEAVMLDSVEYRVFKNVQDFKRVKQNSYIKKISESSFIRIQVAKCLRILEIGAHVKFQNLDLYVAAAVAELVGGALTHRYTLVAADGLQQKPILNPQIAGASVEGKVMKVTRDLVKVQLDEFEIDKNEAPGPADLWPFVYASFYTNGEQNGWYCLPEEGDRVKTYFPTGNEENAFVMASVRTGKQKGKIRIGNPNIKYFRTKFEKVLVMGEEEIILTCYGPNQERVELRFNDGSQGQNLGRIKIASFGKIAITAAGSLRLHSGQNLKISAGRQLELQCKASRLKLNGETRIFSNPAKLN